MSTSIHCHLKQNIKNKKNKNIHTEFINQHSMLCEERNECFEYNKIWNWNIQTHTYFPLLDLKNCVLAYVCISVSLIYLIHLHWSWCYFVPLMKGTGFPRKKERKKKQEDKNIFTNMILLIFGFWNLETTLHLLNLILGFILLCGVLSSVVLCDVRTQMIIFKWD